MDIFDLVASLSLDSTPYEKGLKDAEDEAQTAGSKLGNVLGKLGAGASVAVGAVATGVTALGGALVNGVNDLASYGDNIDKMSQKLGMSAEAYQEWDAVLQHSGTSIDSMSRGMQTLQKNAVNSAEKFEALGITQEQLASMSTEELFSATITGLQQMGEGAERTALASDLLGGSAKELGALLNTSAEDTQAMKDRVHELGGVLSDEAVKASAGFQDQLQDMQTASQSLSRNLLSEFLPSITTVMGGLTDIFAGDYEGGAEKIATGIDEAVTNITEKLPQVMDVGAKIIMSLANSIVTNAPKILKAGIQVIKELAMGLTDALPSLLDTASDIITTVIDSLTETLPELLPKLLSAVLELVSRLLDHLPEILESVLGLIEAIAESLLSDGLPMIIKALPSIILGIVNFILGAIPDIISTAITIVMALVDAFPDILKEIVNALPLIITGIISALFYALPQLTMAGIQLFLALIKALPQIVIDIVKAVPEIIKGIINALQQNMPNLMAMGKKLLTAIANGLMNLGTTISEAVKKVWNAIKEKFTSLLGNAKTWGKDLLDNFVEGIKSKITAVVDTVKNVASKVKDFLGFSEPKLGPLSNFHTYAPDMMQLFAKGVKENTDVVTDQIGKSFDFSDQIVSVTNEPKTDTMNADGMGMAQASKVIELLTQLVNKEAIVLSPDADGIFEIVKEREKVFRTATGYAY